MMSSKQLSKYEGESPNNATMYMIVIGALQYCTLTRP